MNDRELLELAAKAANITGLRYVENEAMQGFVHTGLWCNLVETVGNPLTDDGDALRLAVKLALDVEFRHLKVRVWCPSQEDWVSENLGVGKDFAEQTRRAIVRAAAEIGRGV